MAVGTVPLTGLSSLLTSFRPDYVQLPTTHPGKFKAGKVPVPAGAQILFAHPEWRDNRTKLPFLGKQSYMAHNAWSMSFHQLFRREGHTLDGTLPLEPLTSEWVARWEAS